MTQTNKKTKVIGITGPSGAGKSLFRSFLEEKGLVCIDADEVYHDLLIPPSACLDSLREAFGDAIFVKDGALDRKALGEIVFHDPTKLTLLNQTVLPHVLDRISTMIEQNASNGVSHVFLDAPTLIESGFHRECDAVISVLSSPELRLSRIMTRDEISEEKASLRIAAQKDDNFYRAHSDLVLFNDGDTESLIRHATEFLATLDIHL